MMQPDEGDDYGAEGEGEGQPDAGGMAALQEMANNSHFANLRQRIMENPNFYVEFLQMLQTQNP